MFMQLSVLLMHFHCYEIATVAVVNVLTAGIAATDSTTAITISTTA